jgi:hypothetical protein
VKDVALYVRTVFKMSYEKFATNAKGSIDNAKFSNLVIARHGFLKGCGQNDPKMDLS